MTHREEVEAVRASLLGRRDVYPVRVPKPAPTPQELAGKLAGKATERNQRKLRGAR